MPVDFSDFIDSSLSCVSLSDDLDDKVSMLNSVLLSGLDTLAPLKSRSVSFVHSAPWYNDNLCAMKALCRKMKRRWCMSGLTVHHQAWKESLLEYKAEIVSARSIYFSQIIVSNQRNPKQLFHSINKLNYLSNFPASTHLCNMFLGFFNTKIDNIHNHIINTNTSAASSLCISPLFGISLSNFAIHDSQSLCNMFFK